MKIALVIIAALAATMIVLPVEAQNLEKGADVLCSKKSIGLSTQWAVKEAALAKHLNEQLGPPPKKDDYWSGSQHRQARTNWLLEKQNALQAAENAIAANDAMERLVLQCAILKRLGLGA